VAIDFPLGELREQRVELPFLLKPQMQHFLLVVEPQLTGECGHGAVCRNFACSSSWADAISPASRRPSGLSMVMIFLVSASNGSQMPRFLVPMQLCRVPHPHEIRESGKVLETA
jgi:hypothetical protein